MRYAEILTNLEGVPEDRFVLHGSPYKVSVLEPRQTTYNSHKEFAKFGLYGTPYVEIALLYALIHESRGDWGWAVGGTITSPKLYVHAFEGFSFGCGHVYVLNRKPFRIILKSHGQITITRKCLEPVERLEVDEEVFHELIERNKPD
jgi:hypothetical protein